MKNSPEIPPTRTDKNPVSTARASNSRRRSIIDQVVASSSFSSADATLLANSACAPRLRLLDAHSIKSCDVVMTPPSHGHSSAGLL